MKRIIKFNDDELLEALANYFKIKKEDITSWYIRSVLGNDHTIEYEEKNE